MPGENGKTQSRAELIRQRHRAGSKLAEALSRIFAPLLATPRIVNAILVALCFVLVATALAVWARRQPMVAVGRVMTDTRLVRVKLSLQDLDATKNAQESARQRTARVFAADVSVLQELRASLESLPRTLAKVESLDQVDPKIREQFGLTPDALKAIKAETANGEPTAQWLSMVGEFMSGLRTTPLLDTATWQRASQEGLHSQIRLTFDDPSPEKQTTVTELVARSEIRDIGDEAKVRQTVNMLAREAGFPVAVRPIISERLLHPIKPTFRADQAATALAQEAAASAVKPVIAEIPVGQVIFRREDILTDAQLSLYKAEMAAFARDADKWRVWLRDGAIATVVAGVTLAMIAYAALFAKQMRRSSGRIIGVCALLASSLAVGVIGTALKPELIAVTSVLPTLLVVIVLCVAYDQRVALAFAVLHGLLVCLALSADIGSYVVIFLAVCAAVFMLRDVRDRSAVIRMSVVTGVAVMLATAFVGAIERPLIPQALWEIVSDSLIAGGATVALGGSLLFFLPTIERAFDITTGMTLIELRDPKHPLLRDMQMRAPGTYNHSLSVANITEAAADAIGANSLLAYVGALYHDIGKMNKPEYFVENQGGGPNRHDKLTPAMSLLVVVGHVKDGMEMARAFGLPRTIQHFIESHHGTTLVEFFYHRARKRALDQAGREGNDLQDVHVPDEIEYRYPGPRPQTREAAILMVADAVESAARALSDPTPARLEALVQAIANKRLMDGQFEDCEITMRDLSRICESISRTLVGMHHSRIDYPEPESPPVEPKTGSIRV
ncbi:MAG: HDIG domain-containing protein [Phycisphaerales bacterium]|nr:HDIG domain-containing protein [Planctomycetota bacterium]